MLPSMYASPGQRVHEPPPCEQVEQVGDPNVVKPMVEKLGMDPDAVERDDVKDKLRANTDDAVARGAFGAPTFFVGDAMFWGNDRMHFVEAALR